MSRRRSVAPGVNALAELEVPGTRLPRGGDVWRMWWWTVHGYVHATQKSRSVRRRMISLLCALVLLVTAPLWWAWCAWALFGPGAHRAFLAADSTAMLVIRAHGDRWILADHLARRPGTGQGRALRAVLAAPIARCADAQKVTIQVTAAAPQLVEQYRRDDPRWVVEHTTATGQVMLIRRPAS